MHSLSENFNCLLFSLVCLNYGLPVYKWEHFISFSGKATIICGNSILLLILPIKKELPGLCKSDCSLYHCLWCLPYFMSPGTCFFSLCSQTHLPYGKFQWFMCHSLSGSYFYMDYNYLFEIVTFWYYMENICWSFFLHDSTSIWMLYLTFFFFQRL